MTFDGNKVMIFGTFDIVHCGHMHMFSQAREYGDELVVVVARDNNVEKVKGLDPMHNEEERKGFLEQIKLIDQVVLGSKDDVYAVIGEHRPDVIALGYDQKIFVDKLAEAIGQLGLNINIVRLTPYQENKFKGNKIRKYIERMV